MKYFILLCAVAFARALDCSEGQATWCQSISAAKECGAVDHCKDTVWKTMSLREDPSDVCTFCESIMGDVQKWLKDQKSEDEIKNFLESACNILPEADLQKKCTDAVENDLPILLLLISEELDPAMICGLMKLCKNADLFEEPQIEEPTALKQVLVTGDICADCKTFFGDIRDEITSQTTEKQLEDMIDNLFCNNLGGFAEECKQLVADYVPEVLQMLADQLDPAMECQAMGFCTPTDVFARTLLPRLRLMKSKFHKQVHGDEYCDLCKSFIGELQTLEQDPGVEQQLENAIDEILCTKLGELADLCKQEIGIYLPELLKLVASELSPEDDCKAIGLCTNNVEFEEPEETNAIDETYPYIEIPDIKITEDDLKALRESGPRMTKKKKVPTATLR